MNQLGESRSRCIIESAVQLALLFESESEWEAAEKTRCLLYHFLGENFSAALTLCDSLGYNTAEFIPAGSRREIAQHLADISSILCLSVNGEEVDDSVPLAATSSSKDVPSAATAFL